MGGTGCCGEEAGSASIVGSSGGTPAGDPPRGGDHFMHFSLEEGGGCLAEQGETFGFTWTFDSLAGLSCDNPPGSIRCLEFKNNKLRCGLSFCIFPFVPLDLGTP